MASQFCTSVILVDVIMLTDDIAVSQATKFIIKNISL